MKNNEMKIDNTFENNEINTAFDFKGAHVGIINFYNPFTKDITTNNNQIVHLKFIPNTKYYNFIKIFNGILTLSYFLFITYFIITEKLDPNLILAKTTLILMIYYLIYNILGLKLIINKDYINFKNKTLYFNEIRKIDFDKEYKFIEIYIKGEFRKNKLDCIYPDMTIYFDNKYRTKAVEDYWENYKSKSIEAEVVKKN